MDDRQFPSSATLDPHMSESQGEGRARRVGRGNRSRVPRIDADVLYRLLSGNNQGVAEIAYDKVAPVKRDPAGPPGPQQRRHGPVILV